MQLGESKGVVRICTLIKTCETPLDTTKLIVVVISLFNLVILSCPDNMYYHAWTRLLVYHDGCNNVVQICPFKSVRSSSHVPNLFQHAWTCMNKPVNNLVSKNKLCVFAWVEALHLNLERNSAKYLQYSDTSYIGWRYSVSGLKRFEFSLKMKLPFMTQTFSFTLQPPGRSWRHWPRHYFTAVKFYCSETIRY